MIRYLKAPPTTYVMQFKNGKVKREGAGLSFFYWAPTTTLVMVPLASADVPFAFNEVTADFQALTVQGQLTFRVADPKKLAGLLDYEVDATGRHLSEDPQKLEERLVHAAQVLARAGVQSLAAQAGAGAERRAARRRCWPSCARPRRCTSLGVEVLALSVLSVRPTPEMGRALEAEAREALQREADEAIYERRNSAVEQERRIKESELAHRGDGRREAPPHPRDADGRRHRGGGEARAADRPEGGQREARRPTRRPTRSTRR